jgi:hypothetical protein
MPAVFCWALRPFFDAPGHDITAKNSTVWRSIMSPANHKSKASIKTNEVDRLDVVAGVTVDRLLRLPQVLRLIPVSRSTWFSGGAPVGTPPPFESGFGRLRGDNAIFNKSFRPEFGHRSSARPTYRPNRGSPLT